MSIINPSVWEQASEWQTAFRGASPFKHAVIEDFFSDEFCQCLVAEFPPFDERLAINENGQVGQKCTHQDLPALGGVWAQVDKYIKSPEFLSWLSQTTGINDLLYDPHYFGGGTHENRHGQDLDVHVDFNRHPITGWHRRLNLIVYLNDEWDNAWGGAIEFHKDPRSPDTNEMKLVKPALNRAVIFETTYWSWHGFERINLPEGDNDPRSRKSLALYFYTKTRPESELTPPHSTIYVERQLPAHIQPGIVLSDEDHATIVRLLARRDQHLKRLYDNILDLGSQLEGAQHSEARTRYRRLRAFAKRVATRLGLRQAQ
jgi:hypothetical protein